MSGFRQQLQGLVVAIAFGGLALALVTGVLFRWPAESAIKVVLLYMCACLFLMALSGLRQIAPPTGEAMGTFFGSAVGGIFNGWLRSRGEVSRRSKDQLKESVVRAAIGAIDRAPESEAKVSLLKLNMTFDAIVLRYHEGLPISREAMTRDDITTQAYWNLANYCLNVIGLRRGRAYLSRGDVREDLRYIRRNVVVYDDVVMVRDPRLPGKHKWHRVDLKEAHFIVP